MFGFDACVRAYRVRPEFHVLTLRSLVLTLWACASRAAAQLTAVECNLLDLDR